MYTSCDTVMIATNLAVICFNHGLKGLAHLYECLVGSSPSALTADFFQSKDNERERKAKRKAENSTKERRKALRAVQCRREDRLLAAEGVTYMAGHGFDSSDSSDED